MSHTPAYHHNISMKLASVLQDIGLNEKTVQIRRRSVLLWETMQNINYRMNGRGQIDHMFGSQSEATTTIGLKSDRDIFMSNNDYSIVLQDYSELVPGLCNLLMIQDEQTPPGYCMLHVYNEQLPPDSTTFYKGYCVLKNSFLHENNKPPTSISNGLLEVVSGIPFKTLPNFVSTWLQQQQQRGRLPEDMKRYIESHPCYVVPVGSKGSRFEKIEWRISTSHAERCLMFSLNITQIQCYTMLKFMLKTELKHPSEKGLSSFMCKNVLLLCIDDTEPDYWCPQNLLSLFRLCLLQLQHCVSEEYLPHFIMYENNLMAGKFTREVKDWLLDKIQNLYQDSVSPFLALTIDDVGSKLQIQLDMPHQGIFQSENPDSHTVSRIISGLMIYTTANRVSFEHKQLLNLRASGQASFNGIITKFIQLYQGSDLEQAAIQLQTPLIYSSLGSEIASRDIEQGQAISPEALVWLSLGLKSDVASGRLKLASVYYCTGDYTRAEAILRMTEEKYDKSLILAVCQCNDYEHDERILRDFINRNEHEMKLDHNNEDDMRLTRFIHDYIEHEPRNNDNTYGTDKHACIRHVVAYCVRFLKSEINCQPKELKYEMFRSTKLDLEVHRNKDGSDYWMKWAVVDSLPYMYFLQYKTYGHLQRRADQKRALTNFINILPSTSFNHNETALNLLGQCMVQENKYDEAFAFYVLSLKIRLRNNAASIHICRLLNSLISSL